MILKLVLLRSPVLVTVRKNWFTGDISASCVLLLQIVDRWTETPATLGDIELSQYHFISLDSGHINSTVRDTTKSVAYLLFGFERAIGFYVLQVYTPLIIIVMSSWVSFWLVIK